MEIADHPGFKLHVKKGAKAPKKTPEWPFYECVDTDMEDKMSQSYFSLCLSPSFFLSFPLSQLLSSYKYPPLVCLTVPVLLLKAP